MDIILDSFDLNTWSSPGWSVESISSKSELQQGLDKYKMSPNHWNWAWFASTMEAGWDYSAQVMTLNVQRESDFYVLNMIMPIWLLMILSWSAFFMDPEAIDGRMGKLSRPIMCFFFRIVYKTLINLCITRLTIIILMFDETRYGLDHHAGLYSISIRCE